MSKPDSTDEYVDMSKLLVASSLRHTMRKYFEVTKKDTTGTLQLNALFIGVLKSVVDFIEKNHDEEVLNDINKYIVTPKELYKRSQARS